MPIFKDRTKVEAETVLQTITPSQAAYWLEHCNPRNRPVNKANVNRLAHDMSAGNWKITNQGIAFSPRGQLLDGQHRLHAVIQSGVTIQAFVFNNVDPASQLVIDQGAKRSAQHAITLQGGLGTISNFKMATLRSAIRGYNTKHPVMSIQEEMDLMAKHDEAIEFAISCLPKKDASVRGIVTSTTSGVIARAWYSQDPAELQSFCNVLCSSMGREERDKTIIVLRNFLLATGGRGGGSTPPERYAKTQRALAAWLSAEVMSKIYGISSKNLFMLPGEK